MPKVRMEKVTLWVMTYPQEDLPEGEVAASSLELVYDLLQVRNEFSIVGCEAADAEVRLYGTVEANEPGKEVFITDMSTLRHGPGRKLTPAKLPPPVPSW
jgi:hypothetical protein